jgi:hypothetical protein
VLGGTIVIMILYGRRQLRAYVMPIGGYITADIDEGTLTGRIILKNAGQTPAYKVRYAISTRAFDLPLIWNAEDAQPMSDRTHIAPGIEHEIGRSTAIEVVQIRRLQSAPKETDAFIWGRVDYADAFGGKRWTTFRYRLSGGREVAGSVKWKVRPADAGNETEQDH